MRYYVSAGLVLGSLVLAGSAAAQTATSPCQQWITEVPVTLSAPGYYCLKKNIETALIGGAIDIAGSDVTVDCRGRSITHVDPENDAFGITGGGFGPVENVTVRSCTIVNFGSGIIFSPRSNKIEIIGNDILKAKHDGILIWGNNSRIIGNNVLNTHNTLIDYSRNITITAFEPGVRSTGNVVTNNVVAGAFGNERIWGVRAEMSDGILVNNNQIIDLQPSEGGFAAAITLDDANARVLNNVMTARAGNNYGNTGNPALCARNVAIGLITGGFEWCAKSVNNVSQP